MSLYKMPDHPVIQNMEGTGYPDGKEPEWPICPSCETETDTFYKDELGIIIGCENCIATVDAWEESLED